MKQKKVNLAAGRLGIPSFGQPDAAGPAIEKNPNYGVERLGITAEDEPESPEAAQEKESSQAEQEFASLRATAGQPEGPADTTQTPAEAAGAKADTAQRSYPSTGGGKAHSAPWERNRMLLPMAAAVGGVLAAGLIIVGWWCLSDSGVTPQSASASDSPPAVAVERPAAVSPPEKTQQTPSAGQLEQTARKPAKPVTSPDRSSVPGDETVTDNSAETPEAPAKPPLPAGATPGESTPGLAVPVMALSEMAFVQAFKLLTSPRRPAALRQAGGQLVKAKPPAAKGPGPKAVNDEEPQSAFEVAPAGLQLVGIMRGSDGWVAIINNRSVKVGMTVAKAKVTRIGQFSVELERDGRRFQIGVSAPGASQGGQGQPTSYYEPAATTQPAAPN